MPYPYLHSAVSDISGRIATETLRQAPLQGCQASECAGRSLCKASVHLEAAVGHHLDARFGEALLNSRCANP